MPSSSDREEGSTNQDMVLQNFKFGPFGPNLSIWSLVCDLLVAVYKGYYKLTLSVVFRERSCLLVSGFREKSEIRDERPSFWWYWLRLTMEEHGRSTPFRSVRLKREESDLQWWLRRLRLRLIGNKVMEAWPWLVFGFWRELEIGKTKRRGSLDSKDRERKARW